jgi:uncharacterized membrane protein YvbJ
MPYCHKCGAEVKVEDAFCPQCGVTLKTTTASTYEARGQYRSEKAEKSEKSEKNEKEEKMEKGEQPEKYEKREFSVLSPLVGGIILIIVGFMFYLAVTGILSFSSIFPFLLIIVGIIVILGVAVGAIMASKRNPKP